VRTDDFFYLLPPERIAQTPVEPRHASRLLALNRANQTMTHAHFFQVGDFLRPGDLLVLNETRVIPARLHARKETGGFVEILLLRHVDNCTWEALVGGKRLNRGKHIRLIDGPEAEIVDDLDGSRRLVRFSEPVEEYFSLSGEMPLPPYIHSRLKNPERYQTVYARTPGSAAAPTAGLHFTPELMQKLEQQGIRFTTVTLHVGLDTFAPVTEDDPTEHKIHTEWCELLPGTVEAIRQTRQNGGRVVAVGTTSVRTLESAARGASPTEIVLPYSGPTDLFILPGYQFRVVDVMITNFHLPRSTLLMLVSAFAGREFVLKAYQEAIEKKYRFFSFGDAMLIE
jgi:S-adenosylmethionine:tRNA ribosyltransferase-isomerase